MSRAVWIQGWSSGTVLRLPTTSASGTGSVPSPRAATMTPNTPWLMSAGARRAQPRREQAVGRRRRAAALQVTEDRDPRLQPGQLLELLRQLQRAVANLLLDLADLGLRRPGFLDAPLAAPSCRSWRDRPSPGPAAGRAAFCRDIAPSATATMLKRLPCGCAGESPRRPPRCRRESRESGSRRRRPRCPRRAPASRRGGP